MTVWGWSRAVAGFSIMVMKWKVFCLDSRQIKMQWWSRMEWQTYLSFSSSSSSSSSSLMVFLARRFTSEDLRGWYLYPG